VEPVRTRDAVAAETPAKRATSASVGGASGAIDAGGTTDVTVVRGATTVAIGVTALLSNCRALQLPSPAFALYPYWCNKFVTPMKTVCNGFGKLSLSVESE
jgi:hypothetical protein